jgi:CcmD family protein
MKNFESLFAAWMAVWAVFFLYDLSVARRLRRLQDELDRLRETLAQK